MDFFQIIIVVVGLCMFETVSSIDNAIINAEVLGTMSLRARRWFLFWGILFAVFIVRGVLPLIIVWATMPQLGFIGSFTATFSNDPNVIHAIERSAPILLSGGGTFLILLFLHWLFQEPKNYAVIGEKFFHKHGSWFFAVASIVVAILVWISLKFDPFMAFSIVLGSAVFFVTHGFKQSAEHKEYDLSHKQGISDLSKILYLEVIDATFSIDGVLGAFAFTMAVPLILLGNGLGAVIVRQITVSNIENIKKYKYLKNGALYSIFILGIIMVLDSFQIKIPFWLSPSITFVIVGFFFFKSKLEIGRGVTDE